MAGPARATVWAITHPGTVRPSNEDAIGAGLRLWTGTMDRPAISTGSVDEVRIVTVSDGIVGGRAGHGASRLACMWLAEAAFESAPEHDWRQLLTQIHARMTATGNSRPEWNGMGATVAGVRLHADAVNWPVVPDKLADAVRREEIAAELRESAAEVVITLGDLPLEWFGTAFGSERSLGAYGRDPKTYVFCMMSKSRVGF